MHIAPEIKYENEGGLKLEQCFSLLDDRIKLGMMPGVEKITLLKAIIFNFLIGNGDAYGKNFSILYQDTFERLAPFYDLMSTVVYSNPMKAKMAMKLSNTYTFKNISSHHFERLSTITGFRVEFIHRWLTKLTQDVSSAAVSLCDSLNKDPKTASGIYEKIVAIIQKNARQI